MTPEHEKNWRAWAATSDLTAALSMPTISILILIEGLRELLEALDSERKESADLKEFVRVVRQAHKNEEWMDSLDAEVGNALHNLDAQRRLSETKENAEEESLGTTERVGEVG